MICDVQLIHANTILLYGCSINTTDFPIVKVYVTDFPVVKVYVTDFPVVKVYVTDFPSYKVHVDELSSARMWQHKLSATLSANQIKMHVFQSKYTTICVLSDISESK
jgi:hypothetical protein